MDALNYPRYSDYYCSRTIVTQNHKGGTGKSTTSGVLAVAAALDLHLNARILLIEWDPQGSIGSGMIQSVAEDDVFLTAIDAILGVYEEDSDYRKYLDLGYSEEQIIEGMPFQHTFRILMLLPHSLQMHVSKINTGSVPEKNELSYYYVLKR